MRRAGLGSQPCRAETNVKTRVVYLDHNATTPLHPEVAQAITEAMEVFGNPSSLHTFGRAAREGVEQARAKTAELIGAAPEEITFVGSGSEANNTVLSVLACTTRECACCGWGGRRGTGIVTTAIEHPCVLETAKCLEGRGTKATFVGVDSCGKVDPEELESAITDTTGLLSVMTANNEIGVIQDVKRFAKIAHARGALFHTDAVQAVGKMPMNVRDLDVDFLTLSAHKIYGPKGVGALYVKRGVPFCPLICGGHQEQGRRAGTENTLGIIGLGKAAELRLAEMESEERRLRTLRAALADGIIDRIPDVLVNGHPTDTLPNTLNVSFAGAEGESLLLYLDMEGIAVSTGSACASGSLDPSHVLLATGVDAEQAHGSIRMSMGRGTQAEDIEYVLEVLPRVVGRVRSMSTAYRRNAS
ncbi:MAG TPA: aminotransferase class V-fold PLP-dependent enzyme [Candidatus Hydrogenedentes bacterium]|nr:aminotransferase class V-fold PLP-dependent enzyme [Candidatus Hydrogenedentota bacterium]